MVPQDRLEAFMLEPSCAVTRLTGDVWEGWWRLAKQIEFEFGNFSNQIYWPFKILNWFLGKKMDLISRKGERNGGSGRRGWNDCQAAFCLMRLAILACWRRVLCPLCQPWTSTRDPVPFSSLEKTGARAVETGSSGFSLECSGWAPAVTCCKVLWEMAVNDTRATMVSFQPTQGRACVIPRWALAKSYFPCLSAHSYSEIPLQCWKWPSLATAT